MLRIGCDFLDNSTVCAFTGHRTNKLPWGDNENDPRCIELKGLMYDAADAVYHAGVRRFICGMALGCDIYFCETIVQLRGEHPGIILEAAIPFEQQSAAWSERDRRRYDRLVTECDIQTVVSSEYSHGCYMKRNQYMIDRAGVLIAAYDGTPGGTQNTILYAIRQGLEIIELPIPGESR